MAEPGFEHILLQLQILHSFPSTLQPSKLTSLCWNKVSEKYIGNRERNENFIILSVQNMLHMGSLGSLQTTKSKFELTIKENGGCCQDTVTSRWVQITSLYRSCHDPAHRLPTSGCCAEAPHVDSDLHIDLRTSYCESPVWGPHRVLLPYPLGFQNFQVLTLQPELFHYSP